MRRYEAIFASFIVVLVLLLGLTSCNGPDGVINVNVNLNSDITPTETTISVTKIGITNEEIKTSDTGEKYIVVRPDENEERKIQLQYSVYPENATDSGVTFVYDKQNTSVFVDEKGMVTFTEKGAVVVRVVATDGSNVSDTIRIIAR